MNFVLSPHGIPLIKILKGSIPCLQTLKTHLMIRIIATADLHGELPDIPECDLLLIGGDVCPDGSLAFQAKWLDSKYRNWLQTIPAKEIVGIAGNHDLIFEKAEHLVPHGLRWHYLKDSAIELYGFKIYGTPWQLPFWGAFNLNEEKLAKQYTTIPQDVDILISHGPPHGIFDEVPLHTGGIQHTGSLALRNKVFEIKPKLCVYGHIHCSFGICKLDEIVFANVCLLNDEMEVTNQPVLFSF